MIGEHFNSLIGGLAVTFFFVLSGFLITSLLLKEKEKTGTINILSFMKKRSLRIWPLYYAALAGGYILSIFIIKDTASNPLQNGLVLNALLLSNFAFAFGKIPGILIPIWSIGPEEQFYFIWPFLVRRATLPRLSKIFIVILAIWFIAGVFVHFWGNFTVIALVFRTRIDCMAVGGIFALQVLYKDLPGKWTSRCYGLVQHRMTGITGIMIFTLCLFASERWHLSTYQIYALLFGVLIVRTSSRAGGWLESNPLKFLGEISYGIYLLNLFVIYFIFGEIPFLLQLPSPWGDLIAFMIAGLLSVLAATISYRLLETPFLRMKGRAKAKPLPFPG
jgi:peptidoglycan/LPS O-acetylase OafA/YrhL